MQDHMRWSDIALSSGGSTVWELSFYETPMLLMPVSVPEEKIGEHMVASKAAIMIKTSKKVNFQNVFIKLSAMIKDKKHRLSLGIKAISLAVFANLFQGHTARQSSQPYILFPISLRNSTGM